MLPELMGHSIWWEPKPLTGLLGLGCSNCSLKHNCRRCSPSQAWGRKNPFSPLSCHSFRAFEPKLPAREAWKFHSKRPALRTHSAGCDGSSKAQPGSLPEISASKSPGHAPLSQGDASGAPSLSLATSFWSRVPSPSQHPGRKPWIQIYRNTQLGARPHGPFGPKFLK